MPNEFGDRSSPFGHHDGLTSGCSPDKFVQPRLKGPDPNLHHDDHILREQRCVLTCGHAPAHKS